MIFHNVRGRRTAFDSFVLSLELTPWPTGSITCSCLVRWGRWPCVKELLPPATMLVSGVLYPMLHVENLTAQSRPIAKNITFYSWKPTSWLAQSIAWRPPISQNSFSSNASRLDQRIPCLHPVSVWSIDFNPTYDAYHEAGRNDNLGMC